MIKIHIHEANKTSRFRNLFQPKTPKSNSFSEHFNTKSHNLVVNFFILTIDTPTYLSNQTNLPRPPNKIFFLPNIPLKVTAPYLRCRQTKNTPNQDSAWSHFSYPLLLLIIVFLTKFKANNK